MPIWGQSFTCLGAFHITGSSPRCAVASGPVDGLCSIWAELAEKLPSTILTEVFGPLRGRLPGRSVEKRRP